MPEFDPSFALILDLSKVTAIDIPASAIEQLSRDRTMFEKDSVQVIVAPEKLKFELAKAFRTKSAKERPSLEIARSLEAALAIVALDRTANRSR